MYDIIAMGDSTVDVFLEIDDATVLCDLDKESCRLCINYADKLPVRKMTRVNAVGNAANHAVGTARLGHKAALVSIVGNDDTGREIVKVLKAEGVATKFISIDRHQGTNYSTVINYKGERTILVYHERREYVWPNTLPKATWVYFTSMGEGHDVLYPDLLEYVQQTKTKLAFNPGTYQLKNEKKIEAILRATEVLFVNKEETKRLLEQDITDIKELLRVAKSALGSKIIVITDGQKGSYVFDGSRMFFLDIFDAPVVERTGCGDAYGSGFIGALAYGLDIPDAMRWGSINAAGVLQYIGAQQGLQTRDQIEHELEAHADYQPQEL